MDVIGSSLKYLMADCSPEPDEISSMSIVSCVCEERALKSVSLASSEAGASWGRLMTRATVPRRERHTKFLRCPSWCRLKAAEGKTLICLALVYEAGATTEKTIQGPQNQCQPIPF